MRRLNRLGLLAIVLAVLVAGFIAFVWSPPERHVTAYFTRVSGLYVGDDVRVLGVRVGRVDSIHPEGGRVRVELTLPASRKIPADAKAVIVSPSLVASRYVQLAPVYTGGPVLPENAVIPLGRTASPAEWDDVKRELTQFAEALGPHGANRQGSLSQAIGVVGDNLGHGNALRLRNTLSSLSRATHALADGRGDLFATVRNLLVFIDSLEQNDGEVRAFSTELTDASALLADNRTQLATMLDTLDQSLGDLEDFLRTNRQSLKTSVGELSTLSRTLAGQSGTLAEVLHVGPTALSNVYNIRDPRFGAMTGRVSASNFQGLAQLLCGAVFAMGPSVDEGRTTCRSALQPLVEVLGLSQGIPGTPGVPIVPSDPSAAAGDPSATSPLVAPGLPPSLGALLGLLTPGGGS